MRALVVEEGEVVADPASRLGYVVVRVQVDLLVFQRAPQSLDEDVVTPAALAVHADLHAAFLEPVDEVVAGKLRALVGGEDLRPAVPMQRLVERVDAEA